MGKFKKQLVEMARTPSQDVANRKLVEMVQTKIPDAWKKLYNTKEEFERVWNLASDDVKEKLDLNPKMDASDIFNNLGA